MLRKVVLGTIGFATLMPAVGAATEMKEELPFLVNEDAPAPVMEDPPDLLKPPPMKVSELPIYEAPHADYAEKVNSKVDPDVGYLRKMLLTPVRTVREQMQTVVDHGDRARRTVQDQYHEMKDKTEWVISYLREEENKTSRFGAVGMGGLTGFIFGLRGGIIRRVFYSGIGTTAMGYVCFPEETRDIIKSNVQLAKQYINIGYNFFYGVKPGDPQLEVTFPELSFPKDFSEFADLTISLASSVRQAVMPPPAKEETKLEEKKE